ncbi:MAG TPA: aminopeptidase [Candidatus Paceibacterota bacterium]|nr:aminopeptidase [Verrucomicrobiota bacterium]HSA12647.1 aminopeptidase [Candidatus Paceibacterota bacterium]
MKLNPIQVQWGRRWLSAPALLLAVLVVSGCRSLSYYGQAIKGHYQVIAHDQKIEKLLADPETPEPLRARLQLVHELLVFAAEDLKLPVNGQYRKYADVHRPFVVWNVEAAPEFSLEPKAWWYPSVGRLEYRGYFTERGARKYGAWLQQKGYDVYLGGVRAYSTLGWFKDPVLNTFIFDAEPNLAETIFHELGHQRVFAKGDTDFNEAFATVVGQEGARRWLQAKADATALEDYLAQLRRTAQFVRLVMSTRQKLESLYGDERDRGGKIKTAKRKRTVPPEQLRQQKLQLLNQLRQEYEALKARWGGSPEYDDWFAGALNNAQLNSVAAYYDLVPGFERLLAQNGGDLERFYEEVHKLVKKPKAERHHRLRALGAAGHTALQRPIAWWSDATWP